MAKGGGKAALPDTGSILTFSRIGALMTSGDSVEAVLCRILDEVARYIPFGYGDIRMYDPSVEELKPLAHRKPASAAQPGCPEGLAPIRHTLDVGVTGWVARHKQPKRLCRGSDKWQKLYFPYWPDTQCELAVPLVLEGSLVGVLNLESDVEAGFSQEQEAVLSAIAPFAAAAVIRARREDELQTRDKEWQARLAALEELHSTILRSRNEASLLHTLAEKLVGFFPHYTACIIRLYDRQKDVLYRMGVSNRGEQHVPEAWAPAKVPVTDGIFARVIRERTSQIFTDLQHDSTFNKTDVFRKLGLQALLSVPLPPLDGETALGCINVYSDALSPSFRDDDQRFLEQIAGFVAIAFASLRASLELAAHRRTSDLCGHRPRSRETLDRVAELACQLTDTSACSIFLDDTYDELVLGGTTDSTGITDFKRPGYRHGEGLTGWIAKHRRPLRLMNVSDRAEIAAYGEDCEAAHKHVEHSDDPERMERNYLGVPILADGRLEGVIRVVGKGKGLPVTPLDETILTSVAEQLGSALAAAREAEKKELALRSYQRRLSELFRLAGESGALNDENAIVRHVVQAAMQALGADTGSIAFYKSTDGKLHFRLFEPVTYEPTAVKQSRPADRHSLVGAAWVTRKPVNCRDTWQDSRAKPLHPEARASLVVPLMRGNTALGVLACDKFTPDSFTEEDEETLLCFAQLAVAFISGARALAEMDDSVQTVAHQLIAPIAAMRVNCESLLSSNPTSWEWRSRRVQTLRAHCVLALNICNNFYLIDQIDRDASAHVPQSRCKPTLLRQMLANTASLFQDEAGDKDVTIEIDGSTFYDLPEIEADEVLLPQVFVNLLDNALKYCVEESEIRVAVAKRDSSSCVVRVSNVGIAIDDEDMARIFQKGYRSIQARAARATGSGIGLPVALKIAKAHGGDIWAASKPSAGVKGVAEVHFFVRLPFAARRRAGC